MAPIDFLPLPAAPSFLAKQESRLAAILRCAAACERCRVDRLRPADRHRGRNGAGSKQRSRRTTMATIGTFKKSGSNEFTGEIVTLSVQAKNVRIVPEASRQRRERPQPPRLRRPRRDRRRLVQALQRGPRLSGPQARRSELHRPDLRQPLRRRGRRRLQPDLVPPQRAATATRPPSNAPPGHTGRGHQLLLATESVGAVRPSNCPITTLFCSPSRQERLF